MMLKVPVLNNMALCLMKMNLYDRAAQILDQVLEVDRKNAKATARKLTVMLKIGSFDKLEKEIAYLRNSLDTFEKDGEEKSDLDLLKSTIA